MSDHVERVRELMVTLRESSEELSTLYSPLWNEIDGLRHRVAELEAERDALTGQLREAERAMGDYVLRETVPHIPARRGGIGDPAPPDAPNFGTVDPADEPAQTLREFGS